VVEFNFATCLNTAFSIIKEIMSEEIETQYEVIVVNPLTGKKEIFTGDNLETIKAEIDSRFGAE
jgi:tRNA A22 N-methylase